MSRTNTNHQELVRENRQRNNRKQSSDNAKCAMQLNESDDSTECCNSGCNNCVLDVRQNTWLNRGNHQQLNANRINVFSGGSYAKFQVKSIIKCTSNVLRLCFQYVHDGVVNGAEENLPATTTTTTPTPCLNIPTTFFLLLRAPISVALDRTSSTSNQRDRHDKDTDDIYISRPYTPFNSDYDALTFDIVVKLIPNGSMSRYINELCVNDITEWKGCFGSFEWVANKYRYLVCICQGVAIAPIHRLIQSILDDEEDDTIIVFIGCFQDIDHILLRDEHIAFRQYWNFQSTIYLSQPDRCALCATNNGGQPKVNCECLTNQRKFNENICSDRLNSDDLIRLYRKLNTNSVCTVFCGVEKLEQVIKHCLDQIDDKTISSNYFNLE